MKRKLGTMLLICVLVICLFLGFVNLQSDKAKASGWAIDVLDSVGSVGTYCSIKVDNIDRPHITYYDGTNGDLKYAVYTGTVWRNETVDSVGNVGQFTSLALNKSGYPRVSYYDVTNGDLKYAAWTGSVWVNETVDSLGVVGQYTSLALNDSGFARISYYDVTNGDLKYARWTGSAWVNETVDSSGNVGGKTSIALDSRGYPHIKYDGGWNVKHAWWDGSTWKMEIVDSAHGTASLGSIAMDKNDNPRMSYYDGILKALVYASWNGTAWNITVVDAFLDPGDYSSLVLDGNDNPHISYSGGGPAVRHAFWNGTAWETRWVESIGARYTSLDLDSHEYAHIAYFVISAADLKYARVLPNPPATPSTPSGPGSGIIGISYSYLTSTTDPDADRVKYTFDWGEGNTSETAYVDSGSSASMSHAWARRGFYEVKVMATDIHGAPSAWSTSLTVAIAGPPDVPTSLTAAPGDGQVALAWSPPLDDGGSSIINYTIHRGTAPGGETPLDTIGDLFTYIDMGLTNGLTYYYVVSARNAAGDGPNSTEVNATPATTPSEPLNLKAVAGEDRVTLSWTVPASDGGSPITGYAIYRGTSSGTETLLQQTVNAVSCVDTNVTSGQTYYYWVRAKNKVGEGQRSNEANATPTQPAIHQKSIFEEMWLWAVIVAVIVLVATGVLIAQRRRGRQEKGEPPAEEQAP